MNKEFGLGLSVGFLAGTIVTVLALHKPVKDIMKNDKSFKARHRAMFDHLIRTMGPYVPRDVLEQSLEYIQFDSIVTHEEGKS